MYYKCISCHAEYPLSAHFLTCQNHSPYYSYLTVMYDAQSSSFNSGTGWRKYQNLLPLTDFPVNFDEQKTPLFKLTRFGEAHGFKNLFLKDESKNPTGSFKDRENFIVINKALEWGIRNIFVVSSGNAAVSAAAYAQKAGIPCLCYVSKSLSVGKRMLISFFGGKLIEQEGTYEQMYRQAIDEKYQGWNCTPGINPLKDEGVKMIGFEIWEDMGVPDTIVVPSGNGTLLYGVYKAFKELQHLGVITTLPRMIGVQIKGAAPLKLALEKGQDFVIAEHIPDSFAEGIIAEESYSSPKVMLALKDTGGTIVEVTDVEMKDALRDIMKFESVLPEPTSLAVFAAVKKISADPEEKIVLVQSSGGMKNLKEIMELSLSSKKTDKKK